jgi:hypothetical protein
VVNPVMTRRVEDPFDRPQFADDPGVDPKLVERVDGQGEAEHRRRNTENGQRPIEDLFGYELEPALPERDGQVVFLALVVNDVGGPDEADAVARAVKPVVREVDPEEDEHPGGDRMGRDMEEGSVGREPDVRAILSGDQKEPGRLLADAAGEVGHRVGEGVALHLLNSPHHELEQDQRNEEGDRVRDLHAGLRAYQLSGCPHPGCERRVRAGGSESREPGDPNVSYCQRHGDVHEAVEWRKGEFMKPTMLNINKAKSLLRAMADVTAFKLGTPINPEEASRKHALGISGDELEDISGYLSTQGWLDAEVGAGGVRTISQAGLDVAQKVRP